MKKENNLIPSLPKGFKDRWGKELALKKKILKIIEANFTKYGFLPLETSPMEISENIGSFLADDDLILCLMYFHLRMIKNLNS